MRIDRHLFEKGLAKSRTRASAMITEGIVFVNGVCVTKSSFEVRETDKIEIQGETLRYVSRGGLKLEAALKAFSIDVTGAIAIDIGASTGGFTDCLLQNGCAKVYAVDSGSHQLAPSLLNLPSVVSMENCNARYLTQNDIGELCDIAVCDLSFISQTLLHSVVAQLVKPNGVFVSLIKPQFEVGRGRLGKGGVVKEEKYRQEAIDKVMNSAECCGFSARGIIVSPITGGDGNTEYLACFIRKQDE